LGYPPLARASIGSLAVLASGVALMARSRRVLHASAPVELAFAFVGDLRHAPRWDPQARSVAMITPGPVGLGTRFELVAALPVGRIVLPYEIVEHVPTRRVVLEGRTSWLRYRDAITFEPEGAGTRIVYDAELELRSVLRLAAPLLPLAFSRIAEVATRGIPAAIERYASERGGPGSTA
jgi:dehydrogenase/reductase SDR family member 12